MNVVVIGDALLDVDLDGEATRLSPDAPVPVIDVMDSRDRAGGAGLVATLLAGDGVDVTLVAAFGADPASSRLHATLDGVRVIGQTLHGPTPVKTRVRAEGHAIARLDEGCGPASRISVEPGAVEAITAADAIVAAEYGRGMLGHPAIRRSLAEFARRRPVVWDPHARGGPPTPGVALATPNRGEAAAFADRAIDGVGDAVDVAALLRHRWRADAVAVTLGPLGAVLADRGPLPAVLPALRVATTDPCGAGDRLAAEAAVAFAEGCDAHEALRRGVARAGEFLRAGGVTALGRGMPGARRIQAVADPLATAADVRARGGTLVATGGCFDLLHAGHVRTLQAARALGDALIVCLNSDASVRRLKGRDRPIIAEDDRVDLLLALECVDGVLVFDEDTPVDALRRLTPDIWVKGGDYRTEVLPEAAVLAEWGARAVTVPHHAARSTSALAAALAAVG